MGDTTNNAIPAAILEASLAMPSLKKEDRNQHGGYNFVSIDDYYSKVASVAHKAGLTWKPREVEAKLVDTGRAMMLMATYEFDLMHKDGGVWTDFFRCSIIHPLQGAQTSGSALSYADKLFMRTTFKVVTGEQDADASDPKAQGEGAKAERPRAAANPVGENGPEAFDPEFWVKTMLAFLDKCRDIEAINAYWTANDKVVQEIRTADADKYNELRTAFLAKRKTFK